MARIKDSRYSKPAIAAIKEDILIVCKPVEEGRLAMRSSQNTHHFYCATEGSRLIVTSLADKPIGREILIALGKLTLDELFDLSDYRQSGPGRQQVMTLTADEFIRRFLLHALPRRFHRIRHYGLLASARRKDHLERVRRLLDVAPPPTEEPTDDAEPRPTCPCCGGTMIIIEVCERRYQPRAPPQPAVSSGTPAP